MGVLWRVLYCAIQLSTLIISQFSPVAPQSAKGYGIGIFLEVAMFLTAMYVSVVVIPVNQQRSIADTLGISTDLNLEGKPECLSMMAYPGSQELRAG
ncbi:hypothetical protein FPV67DRAFT_1540367 [Lyophyllum atratum]|nr:hypothetical protein FPV67DRAFT_1540367 [Lyophyllum atratum]